MSKLQNTKRFSQRPPRWVVDTGERIYHGILILVVVAVAFAIGLLLFPGK